MSTTQGSGFEIEPGALRHLADAAVGVELDTGDMILNLGPQHPATHGTLRLVVRLDGERVVAADPVIGYMHRGYEKLSEFRTYPQITPLINRIDWLSSFANEVPFIHGAELTSRGRPTRNTSARSLRAVAHCDDLSLPR
jgi:NADH-quinone oxidoreductase subunit D